MKDKNSIFKNNLIKNTDAPFDNNCFKQFENFTENLQSVIKLRTPNEPLVVFIEAPYGFGKTTFIDMWGQQLINGNQIALKFDAWKMDYSDEPLASLVSQINFQLGCFLEGKKLEAFKKVACKLLSKTPGILGKFVLNGVTEHLKCKKSFKKLGKDIIEVCGNVLEGLMDEKLKNDATIATIIKSFKEQLGNITSKNIETNVLYLFVDELDRCKPTYTIQILEIIKHIFDAQNVCFIITVNKDGLLPCLNKVYGNDFPAKEYLERFADISITLPTVKTGANTNWYKFIASHIDNLQKDWNLEDSSFVENLNEILSERTKRFILYTRDYFKFSLRETKKYIADMLWIIHSLIKSKDNFLVKYIIPIGFLLAIIRKFKIGAGELQDLLVQPRQDSKSLSDYPRNTTQQKRASFNPGSISYETIEAIPITQLDKSNLSSFLSGKFSETCNDLLLFSKKNLNNDGDELSLYFVDRIAQEILLLKQGNKSNIGPNELKIQGKTFTVKEIPNNTAFIKEAELAHDCLRNFPKLYNELFSALKSESKDVSNKLNVMFPHYFKNKKYEETLFFELSYSILLQSRDRNLLSEEAHKLKEQINELEENGKTYKRIPKYMYENFIEKIYGGTLEKSDVPHRKPLVKNYTNHYAQAMDILGFLSNIN